MSDFIEKIHAKHKFVEDRCTETIPSVYSHCITVYITPFAEWSLEDELFKSYSLDGIR